MVSHSTFYCNMKGVEVLRPLLPSTASRLEGAYHSTASFVAAVVAR